MLLGYKDQFVPKLQSGIKIHTIRAKRKVPIKPGDILHHYGKVRQPGMFKIIPNNTCISNQAILIKGSSGNLDVWIDGRLIDDFQTLSINDGFDSKEQFFDFWLNHPKNEFYGGVYFDGFIHHWTDFRY